MALAYDPTDVATSADPYPVFRRLRDEEPVHRSTVLNGWVLTRYADVRQALSDPRLSSDRLTPFVRHRSAREPGGAIAELGRHLGLWAVFTDPPRHTHLRGLMNRAFTTRAVERLRPRVDAIVEELIDRVAARGRMDLIRDFAYPLPITVIADFLGVPPEERERLKLWSDELATFVGSAYATPDKYERAAQGLAHMTACFRDLIRARRRRPVEDLMSALVALEDGDTGPSEDELVATCVLLLFAGHETTTNLLGNGMLALLRHPGELGLLRDDPTLAAAAVEEMLRYDGPSGAMVRIVADEVEMHGVTLRPGERLFLMINAANRDPRQFPEPDRFDIRREPNRHVAFGQGIHFCAGAPLARLEGQVALPALVGRLRDLALAVAPEDLSWLDSLVFRGVRSLPVSFRAT
jgi:cytochrome P450